MIFPKVLINLSQWFTIKLIYSTKHATCYETTYNIGDGNKEQDR